VDWMELLWDMRRRPTYVNDLVHQTIEDVGNVNALGIGAGDAWSSTIGANDNILWQVEWQKKN